MKKNFLNLIVHTILFININNLVMAQSSKSVKAENDPRILSEVRKFLKVLNSGTGKPIEELSPDDARKVLIDAQKSVTVNYSGIEESERTIMQDGAKVRIHITKPIGVSANAPVFMFIHGGGWVLGDYPTHRRMVRDLVVLSGFAAVFVNYTRTPEAVYPQQINEIYAATKWVAENGDEIDVDGKNMAVVGNSVGG